MCFWKIKIRWLIRKNKVFKVLEEYFWAVGIVFFTTGLIMMANEFKWNKWYFLGFGFVVLILAVLLKK